MDETLQFLNLIENIITEEIEKEEQENAGKEEEPEKTVDEKRKDLTLNGYKYSFGFR
ncbi:hypothetical protein EZS27_004671 [termite gut metagenome]|uniref:Uncharacterized protein n=1 Tax=termite gut metagenome TaxID=433724 RepID=A0A5J4SR58_9ZZZZ